MSATRSDLDKTIGELFDATRTARRLRTELAEAPSDVVLDALSAAIEAARQVARDDERVLRLSSVAEVLGRMTGARTVDLLIDLLNADDPEVRHVAGVELEDLAFDRFKEVALGVERALARLPRQSPALSELPYLLAEIPEPGALKILHAFLDHADPDAVASAIEACVELGDPASARAIAKLEADGRMVELDDESDEGAAITIGELAKEARQILEANEEDAR